MSLKKTLAITSLSVLMSAPFTTNADVFNPFQVNPNAFGDAQGTIGLNPFTADKITGNYVEIATFNLDSTFDVALKWEAGQFVTNNGEDPILAGTTGLGVTYSLYALFNGSGTFSINPATLEATFVFTSGNFDLFYDSLSDGATTFLAPITGAGNWTPSNVDTLLGSAILSSGGGNVNQNQTLCDGLNCGSFGIESEFNLVSPEGTAFFFDPNPFYNIVLNAGQLNRFDVIPGTTQRINGSMDAVFGSTVPEPASVALLGLGLVAFGFRSRKKA